MTKQFTSVITVEFAYNNRVANSKEEYIELLKQQYLEQHDIQFEEIKEFINQKCELIVERSLDWGDSSYGEGLMQVNEPLFELKAILEEVE